RADRRHRPRLAACPHRGAGRQGPAVPRAAAVLRLAVGPGTPGPGPTPVPATPHQPLRSAIAAQPLAGKATAKTTKQEIAERVSRLLEAGNERPGLATVLVGDDPGSAAYVRGKHRDSERVGMTSIQEPLPADAAQADVEALVDELHR